MECWKPVIGFEGYYEVSNLGNIRRDGRNLATWQKSNGYLAIRLSKNDKKTSLHVHRIVAAAFIGPSPLEVNHKNGNKTNNQVENLEYVTHRQNMDDALARGCFWRGARVHCAKLTPTKVRKIRKELNRKIGPTAISKQYGVSEGAIRNIARGRAWSWLQ